MPTKRERRLLVLFAAVCVAAGVGLAGFALRQDLATARRRVRMYEEELATLGQALPAAGDLLAYRASLRSAIDAYAQRRYDPDEMDAYRFGATIQGLLQRRGISVERYQLGAGEDADTIEFAVAGSPMAFAAFLRDISMMEKQPRIGYLQTTVQADGESVHSVFRIGYETVDMVDH